MQKEAIKWRRRPCVAAPLCKQSLTLTHLFLVLYKRHFTDLAASKSLAQILPPHFQVLTEGFLFFQRRPKSQSSLKVFLSKDHGFWLQEKKSKLCAARQE